MSVTLVIPNEDYNKVHTKYKYYLRFLEQNFKDAFNTVCLAAVFLAFLVITTALIFLFASTSRAYKNPNCISSENNPFGNRTVHLVHGPDPWEEKHFHLIERLLVSYPGYRIHITAIHSDPSETASYSRRVLTASIYDDYNTSMQLMQNNRSKRHLSPIMQPRKYSTLRSAVGNMMQTNPFFRNLLIRNVTLNSTRSNERPVITASTNSSQAQMTTKQTSNHTTHRTLDELLKKHPNVYLQNVTLLGYFTNTFLAYSWFSLSEELQIFAVRIMELWQHGGITFSFDISQSDTAVEPTALDHKIVLFEDKERQYGKVDDAAKNQTSSVKPAGPNEIDKNFHGPSLAEEDDVLAETFPLYEMSTEDTVIVDLHGDRLAVKAPCHMFFGQVLTLLRRWKKASIDTILRNAITVFCRSQMVTDSICNQILL